MALAFGAPLSLACATFGTQRSSSENEMNGRSPLITLAAASAARRL